MSRAVRLPELPSLLTLLVLLSANAWINPALFCWYDCLYTHHLRLFTNISNAIIQTNITTYTQVSACLDFTLRLCCLLQTLGLTTLTHKHARTHTRTRTRTHTHARAHTPTHAHTYTFTTHTYTHTHSHTLTHTLILACTHHARISMQKFINRKTKQNTSLTSPFACAAYFTHNSFISLHLSIRGL